MINFLIVGIGGFLGAITRYVVGGWFIQRWSRGGPEGFPMGTFVINVSGSFLIGLLMTLFAERLTVNPQWRLLLLTGFLGAYTTFSTFEHETGVLVSDGKFILAALNVIGSVFAGFVALKLGQAMARV
ncbi:Camphor resistance CrcB protein [Candidatus Magnetobacterium bavaricum]|uniref:Fluoride-specific ion channel FluC n=1 Tax=Candidatus Magnetobacterium bavaricum TaxID=29290 RepID=A0A0F3GNH8_9BACT|nr:Camphor resistance CrcB protein [Candidatus Magnetobacterium bavaricum]